MTVENIQQARAVWNGDRWELHLVCETTIPVEDAPGDKTAGIDLGISNYVAIDYDDGPSELYPGNRLKADKHYFTREEYQTEGETAHQNGRVVPGGNSHVGKTTSCIPSRNTSSSGVSK
ncbi:MAG: putative transposase, partial [Halobacteriales archaeon]